jgi:hypothetical protein
VLKSQGGSTSREDSISGHPQATASVETWKLQKGAKMGVLSASKRERKGTPRGNTGHRVTVRGRLRRGDHWQRSSECRWQTSFLSTPTIETDSTQLDIGRSLAIVGLFLAPLQFPVGSAQRLRNTLSYQHHQVNLPCPLHHVSPLSVCQQ